MFLSHVPFVVAEPDSSNRWPKRCNRNSSYELASTDNKNLEEKAKDLTIHGHHAYDFWTEFKGTVAWH